MSVRLAENEVINKELINAIQDTLNYVKKESKNISKKKDKSKNNDKDNKKEESKVSKNALDSVVDNLLQMKEGERKAQLIRPIVPIREWLSNEYYCGAEVFNLYPFWKEHLIRIYESPVLINEIILTRRFRYW